MAKKTAFQLARADNNTAGGIGLTVNTVTPDSSPRMFAAMPEKALAKVISQIPLGRLGRAEQIARVVHFLAADASS